MNAGDRNALGTIGFHLLGVIVALQASIIVAAYAGGLTLYLNEIAIWAALLPAACALLLGGRVDPLSAGLQALPEVLVYFAIAALAALVSLGIDGHSTSPGKIKNLMAPILMATLILCAVRDAEDVRWLLWWVCVGAAVNGLLGVLQFTTGGPIIVEPHENNVWKESLGGGYLEQTAHGLFKTPNELGVALAPALVLAARLAMASVRGRGMFLLFAVVIGLGLVASAHRGAMIWALAGLAVAFWPLRRKFLLSLVLFATGTLALALIGMLSTRGFGTLTTRVELWEAAIAFFRVSPDVLLWGDGDEAFAPFAARYADWFLPMSHNTFLDQILFYGVFALAAYVMLWGLAMWRASVIGQLSGDRSVRLYADAMLGSLTCLAGILVLEPRGEGVSPIGQVFVIFALVAALFHLERQAIAAPPAGALRQA